MCLGGRPSAPTIPTPTMQPTPTAQEPSVVAERDRDRLRRAAAASNTRLSSVTSTAIPASTNVKSLLGA